MTGQPDRGETLTEEEIADIFYRAARDLDSPRTGELIREAERQGRRLRHRHRAFLAAGSALTAAAVVVTLAATGVVPRMFGNTGLNKPANGASPTHRVTRLRPTASSTASPKPSSSQQGLGVSPPPAPSASGPLHVVLQDPLPVTYSPNLVVIGTEAPDGSVFAAFASNQSVQQQTGSPLAPAGSAVYVVDGDQPMQAAEHSPIPVAALAADDSYLYVGGDNQIVAYNRATGGIAQTWNVAQPVRLMAASSGRLWAVLGSLTGGQVVEINPSTGSMTTVGTDSANVTAVAAGPLGLYYVESGGSTIVHISPDGIRQQAPTNQTVNVQQSGSAAVQAISVIGDQLLLIHDAGQGLDSSSQTYNASTLAGPATNAPGTAGSNRAISSLAGPVDLVTGESTTCKVGRYNLSTGSVTDAVTYPPEMLGPLLGPYPAVFVFLPSGSGYLDRIG
jgi:hypothetical protein